MKIDVSKRAMFKSIAIGSACYMAGAVLSSSAAFAKTTENGKGSLKKVHSCGKMSNISLRQYYEK